MKKRLISLVLIMLLLTSILSMDVGASTANSGKVTADVLNVRSGPGTNYSVVAKLKSGDKVTIIAEKSGWYKLNESRWVSADWVVKESTKVSKHKHPLTNIYINKKTYKTCGFCAYLEDSSGNVVAIGNKTYYSCFEDYTNASGKATNLGDRFPELGTQTSNGFQFNKQVVLSAVQAGLDIGGLIPVIGEPLDAINSMIYLVRKDYANAALSGMSIIPIAGYIGTAGKVYKTANKSIKIIRKADKMNDYVGVAKYIKKFGKLPDNYISYNNAQKLGWIPTKGNLANVLPGKCIGGAIYKNGNNLLPNKYGRIWREADINYKSGYRNSERLLYSNDGLFYKTKDHYKTFTKIN